MIGIYKITNPKGRIYIGQSVNIEKRETYYKRVYCKSQTKIYYSLKKYGWEKHKFEVIEECLRENLNERELYWGKFYNTLSKDNLNLRLGNARGEWSKEILEQMRQSSLGVSRNKGIPKSKEHRRKMSEAVKNRIYTPERLEKMKNSMLGKNTRKIVCINTSKKFSSIKEAAKIMNINERNIGNNLIGISKSAGGNQFKYI